MASDGAFPELCWGHANKGRCRWSIIQSCWMLGGKRKRDTGQEIDGKLEPKAGLVCLLKNGRVFLVG